MTGRNPCNEYFGKFTLDESFVVKFMHSHATNEVCLIYRLHNSQEFCKNSTYAQNQLFSNKPYQTYHKLLFKGVSNYERCEPISVNYRDMDSFEEKRGESSDIIMYGVENVKSKDGCRFSAELPGFGDISFIYADLEFESKVVIEKGLSEYNEECLYIEVETGRVGLVQELFDSSFFNIGDVVNLKSGGPDMTIKSLNGQTENNQVNCIWFDKDNKKHSDDFPYEMLKIADCNWSRQNSKMREVANYNRTL